MTFLFLVATTNDILLIQQCGINRMEKIRSNHLKFVIVLRSINYRTLSIKTLKPLSDSNVRRSTHTIRIFKDKERIESTQNTSTILPNVRNVLSLRSFWLLVVALRSLFVFFLLLQVSVPSIYSFLDLCLGLCNSEEHHIWRNFVTYLYNITVSNYRQKKFLQCNCKKH